MSQERIEQPRVIIADDHPDMLDAVAQQLQSDYAIIGRVGEGVALIKSTVQLRPDFLVTDISMPKLSGLEGLRQLRRLAIQTPAVILTVCANEGLVNEALSLGVQGFAFETWLFSDLQLAVREVLCWENICIRSSSSKIAQGQVRCRARGIRCH